MHIRKTHTHIHMLPDAHTHTHTLNDKLQNTLPTTTGLQSGGERHTAPRKNKDGYTRTHACTQAEHNGHMIAARARRSSL